MEEVLGLLNAFPRSLSCVGCQNVSMASDYMLSFYARTIQQTASGSAIQSSVYRFNYRWLIFLHILWTDNRNIYFPFYIPTTFFFIDQLMC
ncbi:Snaclec echicetin subunit alpha [Dirofilaria immitis]